MNKTLTKYQIYKEFDLIINCYYGSVTISDIKDSMQRLVKEPDFSKEYGFVHDFRNCNLKIKEDELPEYIEFIDKILKIITKRKVIFLTNKPNEVVLATLFSMLLIETPVVAYVFSTIEAAYVFLNNKKLDLMKFKQMLDE